ncbi:MAG: tRNA (adenosine(37)-N6)-dimethylallyltransferase MiaA [Acidimicrobiia bacterium]|nr:tRNA (adenosine(37)-N6)-dimethylallyltransferase MiaA [Acidimicrobiia bacterium]MYJ14474.1 tRNA (adenosine(37)-N6)-dimethylallyltransferase MiaA [Acidimicrobiia bacterium]
MTGNHDGHWVRLAIVGPTASGKSMLAAELARRRPPAELLSMDAMAVYRNMDIGTGSPTAEEAAELPHHGVDLTDAASEYSVGEYLAAVRPLVLTHAARGTSLVAVGGTGLYARAVVDDLEIPGAYPEVRAELEAEPDTAVLYERLQKCDPLAAERTGPVNRRRIVRALEVTVGSGRRFSSHGQGLRRYGPSRFTQVGLRLPRPLLDARIAARFRQQLDAGFLEEARRLRDASLGLSRTARCALGYRELLGYLDGRCSLEEAIQDAVQRTRRFARRQERWFGRDPRITWLDVEEDPWEVFGELMAIFDRSRLSPAR